jgi:hypothetical protein
MTTGVAFRSTKNRARVGTSLTIVNDSAHSADRSPLTQGGPMRSGPPQTSTISVPAPGTTDAVELGCTCRFIAHEASDQEREPAGILFDPDPDCPLHGTHDVSAASAT